MVNLILRLSTFSLFFITVFADEKSLCVEEKCGENGPPIKFPFRLKERQPKPCGYPGFDLSCTNSNLTIIDVFDSPIKFVVTEINYQHSYLNVYNSDQNCSFYNQSPKLANLSVSPFEFDYYLNGSTMFNCSSNLTCFSRGYPIPCLSGQRHSVFVGVFGSYYGRPALDACGCREMFDILSVPPEIFDPDRVFKLTWTKSNCEECEAKAMGCRLKENGAQDETECFVKISGQQTKGNIFF